MDFCIHKTHTGRSEYKIKSHTTVLKIASLFTLYLEQKRPLGSLAVMAVVGTAA